MLLNLLPAAAVLALSGAASAQLEGTGLEKLESSTVEFNVSTRYIVEFSESGSSKFKKRDGSADTEGFYQKVELTNNTAVPALNFTSAVFHGASFELKNATAQSVAEIEALEEVARIWPVEVVYADEPAEVKSGPVESQYDPHVLTKVNDAHSLGFDGRDVIIAVVDSGIDYSHPSLGGGFGDGFKVESGWDFVGDSYNVASPDVLNPDADPKDCMGHGTHVAGIIGSTHEDLLGVAPNARLRAYMSSAVVTALLRAQEDGADINTASLGSIAGFPDSPVGRVITGITEAGTFVSAAAGNSGGRGPFFTSNLANSHGSLTVGSVDHTQQVGYKVVAKSSSGESRTMTYIDSHNKQWQKTGTFNAFHPNVSRDYDICLARLDGVMPPGGLSKDDVIFLPRGKFHVCKTNWQIMDGYVSGKADWAFFYNYPNISYEQPERTIYREGQPKGLAAINYEEGIWLEEQFEAGYSVQFEFKYGPGDAVGIENRASAQSWFSSWGPTLDGRLKPEISAPGGEILSTYPVAGGNWAVMSGTSMATPYIAGIAALFYQSVGGRSRICGNSADAAVRKIASSGSPVLYNNGTTTIHASIAHQGGGLVNAIKVTTFETTVSPATINHGDSEHFDGSHSITIKNTGNTSVTYTIIHETGNTALTRGQANAWVSTAPWLKSDQGLAGVKLSETEITVPAKGRATVDVTFTEPDDVDPLIMAMYGGYIRVIGDNGEDVRTTYLGIKGSLYSADIWELERRVPLFFGANNWEDVFSDGRVFPYGEIPQPYFNILWATREMSFDLVTPEWQPSDWVYPPVPGKNNFVGHTMYDQLNGVGSFPWSNVVRNAGVVWVTSPGNLSHGALIESGMYRVLGRALRTYGNHSTIEDWQVKLSPWWEMAEPSA